MGLPADLIDAGLEDGAPLTSSLAAWLINAASSHWMPHIRINLRHGLLRRDTTNY